MANPSPIYVVTNDGQDVEEVAHWLEALVKRLGGDSLLEAFGQLVKLIAAQIDSYPLLEFFKRWIDQLVAALQALIEKIDPVLAFDLFHPKS